MSFNVLRGSIRRGALAAPIARAPRALRTQAFRKYSTEAPKSSSNTTLFVAAGVVVGAGVGAAWYVYTSSSDTAKEAGTALKSGAQAAKALTNFVPTKEDYQKVSDDLLHDGIMLTVYSAAVVGLRQDCRYSGGCV